MQRPDEVLQDDLWLLGKRLLEVVEDDDYRLRDEQKQKCREVARFLQEPAEVREAELASERYPERALAEEAA